MCSQLSCALFVVVGRSVMSANAEFLETLVSMGFDKDAACIALEATVNSFDEAVALLSSSQAAQPRVGVDAAAEQLNQVIIV